jgi:two-component system cell cycle response regulator
MKSGSLVLVIEDNEANQLLTQSVLERDGYRVEVVGTAEEARATLSQELPSLILMDIQLPGQDGLSLTQELKISPSTVNIPIIALTAHAMGGDREKAIAAGCAGYIAKPIDTRMLSEQIRRILATASMS